MSFFSFIRKFLKCYLLVSVVSCALVGCAISKQKTAGTLAPKAHQYSDAVVQVYGARTWGAKKIVSVHTWVSIKPSAAEEYTSYEIIGWRLKRTGSAFVERQGNPDRDWWGNQPEKLLDIRGDEAESLIPQIKNSVVKYPFKKVYQAWPGPNSNTFTAFIGREVPDLKLDLPSTAIGKDYREASDILGISPSGTGIQASLWGVLGISVGVEEGVELNLLGLNIELDILDFAIELPGVGRLGASDVDELPNDNSAQPKSVALKRSLEEKSN